MNEAPLGTSRGRGIATGFTAREAFHETRYGWLVLGAVWLAVTFYLLLHIKQGWVPIDSGELAEMAQRVLRGQVPHRDFGEIYTGGLTYLNALTFRLFGANLFSLRIPFFLLFLGWIPAIYFIVRRFARPLGAGALTLLAVAWGPVVYPEAMPSWYNLFFATWGVLALIRYTEDEQKRWLWIAGLCGGLSFLVKITGVYFVAAVLLFLVFHEPTISRFAPGVPDPRAVLYRLFASGSLLLFLACLTDLVSQRPLLGDFVYFVLPSACLVFFLLASVWRPAVGNGWRRFRRLFSETGAFAAGWMVPVGLFLIWYMREGAVGNWWRGVFVESRVHLRWIAADPAPLVIGVWLLPIVLLTILACDSRPSSRRLVRLAGPIGLAILLFAIWKRPQIYELFGLSLPLLVPLLALISIFCLRRIGPPQDQKVFLVLSTAILCALIQFPSPGPVYFNYVAPLLILAFAALLSTHQGYDRVALGSLVAFFLLFAVWLHPPGYYDAMRLEPGQTASFRQLRLPAAGGLKVRVEQAKEYESLIRLVQQHASGAYIYCTPNCPEVYVLAGKRNPTPTICQFMEPGYPNLSLRTDAIVAALRDHSVTVAVLNSRPMVESVPIPAGLRAALDTRFPHSERVGVFDVRWK